MKTLIVEDNFTCRLVLQGFLDIYGTSHIAANGKEAVEAVRMSMQEKIPYDLICLDIMMPEMDGQEALLRIRAFEEANGIKSTKGSKILMTTALADIKNVMKAYHSLCDGYLTKPLDKAKVLEELRKLKIIT